MTYDIYQEGIERLAHGIIENAIRDLLGDDKPSYRISRHDHDDAEWFVFRSREFQALCSFLDVDAGLIRKEIAADTRFKKQPSLSGSA